MKSMDHSIITGGSSGIGLALARMLARRGQHITIVGRSEAKLEAAKKEIEACRTSPGQKILTFSADVSSQATVEEIIAQAVSLAGPPDLLITSAGAGGVVSRFENVPIEEFEKVMAVNYFGSLFAIRAVLPWMQTRRRGHICLISSAAGLIGIYGYSVYAPTKFALLGLAETLRSELKRDGIQVTIAYPPDTDTPMREEEIRMMLPETKAIVDSAGVWSAEAVARAVLNGIDKQYFEVAMGAEVKFLRWFRGLFSPVIRWYLDRLIARDSGNQHFAEGGGKRKADP